MAESVDDFVAGWISGAAGVVLTQPLDYLTTRLQSSPLATPLRASRDVRLLWRGVGPLLGAVPLNNALLFYGYGSGVRIAEAGKKRDEASLMPIFVGGCAGGAAQSFLQSPVELIKVRLQLSQPDATLRTGDIAARLLQPTSYAGFSIPPLMSRGLAATLLRDVVPHGVWFATYEWAKRVLGRRAASHHVLAKSEGPALPRLSVSEQLAAGAIAATVAWVVGYPPDVIKTRVQMEGGVETIGQAVHSLYAESGLSGFYRGLGLKLLRAIPMSAVGFLVYEEVMRALKKI